jgi:hypothetical protein
MLFPLLLAVLLGKRGDTRPDALHPFGAQVVFARGNLGFDVLTEGTVARRSGGASGGSSRQDGR